MATRKTTTVKGTEVQPGHVVKIGGRWYRVAKFDGDWGESGIRFVLTVKHNEDPRLASLTRKGSLRIIHAKDEYLTREEPAPTWDWVTRNLAREAEEGWS